MVSYLIFSILGEIEKMKNDDWEASLMGSFIMISIILAITIMNKSYQFTAEEFETMLGKAFFIITIIAIVSTLIVICAKKP